MKFIILADGSIVHATELVADYLIKKGGRECKLKPIETPNLYGNESRGSTGVSELPKPKRSRKPRGSEG